MTNEDVVEFKDMTNAQLKEACEDFGLEVKAKNPAKPNKTEYLEALDTFKAKQDAIHADRNAEKAKVTKAAPVKDGSKRKPQSSAQLMKLDLFKKDRVSVRDMQESQTKDEMISVSWGNRLIGRQTEFVDLSGEPQYIRRGAINNLKEATTVVHIPKKGESGGAVQQRRKRFVVVEVDNLTPEEFDELRNVQSMRNSKLA